MKGKIYFISAVLLILLNYGYLQAEDNFDNEILKDLKETKKKTSVTNKSPVTDKPVRSRTMTSTLAPDFYIALDMIFEGGTKRTDNAPNQGRVREIEFGYKANIDPYFFGLISFVLEFEDEVEVHMHEAYIRYSGLLPGLTIRIGKIFLPLGILNTIHQHDRPFVDSPLVQADMFGHESAADFGLECNSILYFLPFYLRLNIGVFNGKTFGHSHLPATPKRFPLVTARMETFFDFSEDIGLRIGVNHLIRSLDKSDASKYHQQVGVDMTIKALQTKQAGFLFLGELWHKKHTTDGLQKWGFYLLAALRFNTVYEFGLRYDYLATKVPAAGEADTAITPFFTLKPSEFSYLRMQYKLLNLPGTTGREHLVLGQVTFILGAHPAHKY